MSASGIIGTFLGVRSPGTAYVLLHHYMGEIDGAFRAWGFARGGTGAISNAIADAAREAGVEIRTQVGHLADHREEWQGQGRGAVQRRRDLCGRDFFQRRSAADIHEVHRGRASARRFSGRRQPLQVSAGRRAR